MGPSRTAELVCLFRAMEQRRPPAERVVDDPLAGLFLGPLTRVTLSTLEGSSLARRLPGGLASPLVTYVQARHRFIDNALAAGLEGPAVQVAVLGAGYDTRAWRFAGVLAGRPVYELDFPATGRRKARIARRHGGELPESDVRRVEIDFLTQGLGPVLAAAGFRPGAPSFFIWEGVSMYLTREAVKATLATVREMGGPGSRLAMDFWFLPDGPDLQAAARRFTPHLLRLLGEPVTFGMHPEDTGDFLARSGLRLVDQADAAELGRRHVPDGRPVYPANHVVVAEVT
ncbi:MAG: SAM-dependent methyltransferase [Planctomycetes bacterium]|nr:SAM-dependent methyltransferase [Planctomycetota bacterium]